MEGTKTVVDIGLVAFLIAIGIKPLRTDRKSRNFSWEFERSDRLEDEIFKYYERKALADPLAVVENFRNLTAQVREMRR